MKKIILFSVLCISSLAHAGGSIKADLLYGAIQDKIQAIADTCDPIIKSANMFQHKNLLSSLRELGTRINNYVMSKQGILHGKATKGDLANTGNIFDVWSKNLYPNFLRLIDILQDMRLKGKNPNITQLKEWKEKEIFNDSENAAKKIRNNSSILNRKRQIARVIEIFADRVNQINDKAITDSGISQ